MARQVRKSKKVIYVFCEGESEQEYAKCLRTAFADVAAKAAKEAQHPSVAADDQRLC